MMKLRILAFTRSGCRLAEMIQKAVQEKGDLCEIFCKAKEAEGWGLTPVQESLREWTDQAFASCDAILYIGAAGIAVRAIAPFVVSKASDPAVLCMDEQGHFLISLLSGHLGGANALARELSQVVGAVPVITTATDSGGRFSVDDFARRQGLYLDQLPLAKRIAAEVLESRPIGLYSDFEIEGSVPPELVVSSYVSEQGQESWEQLGISISLDDRYSPFAETLHLVPRIVVLGIGCRRGTSREAIEALVQKAMELNQISRHSLMRVASIDLKKDEPGLLEFCEGRQLPLVTYSAEELAGAELEGGFTESDFVRSVTGIGNVCERSALLAAGRKRLMQTKLAENGVTVAIAREDYRVCF